MSSTIITATVCELLYKTVRGKNIIIYEMKKKCMLSILGFHIKIQCNTKQFCKSINLILKGAAQLISSYNLTMTQKQINSLLCFFFITGGKISLMSYLAYLWKTPQQDRESRTSATEICLWGHRALWTLFSLCRIAQFSSACPIMSAQGCWACSVRDAICPIVRVRAAASCDKKVSTASSFSFLSSPSLSFELYSTVLGCLLWRQWWLKPYLLLHHLDSCTRKQESEREIVRWGRKEGWGRRARKRECCWWWGGEGLDRNSRAVSAKDKHISPTKQRASVSMSYAQQTGIKLLYVHFRMALFA